MKKRVFYLAAYLGFWLLCFILLKILFLGYHFHETSMLPGPEVLQILLQGFKLDLSFSAYIAALPFLMISLSVFIPLSLTRIILKIYTLFVVLLVSLLSVIDLELFKAWGFRLDATPLAYLNTPQEMLASADSSPVFLLLLILLACSFLFSVAYFKWVHPILEGAQKPYPALVLVFLFFTASLIIPIRGGLQLAPINISDAYFSANNFSNQAAINVPWNFFNDLSRKTYDGKNPYQFMDAKVAEDIISSDFNLSAANSPNFLNVQTPNVLLIIWESFTANATKSLGGRSAITPNFDALASEGMLFTNFYASADRSDKGLVSILSGYPAQPTQSIMKLPVKSSKLPVLSKSFSNAGYATSFYYGGELEFANIKAYLMNGGFDKIVGKEDFEPKDWNSKWGAHDHVVLDKVLQDLKTTSKPFFSTIFTLSSHEPFEVPIDPVVKGEDEESKFLNSLYYADQSIGNFLNAIKKEPWYEETLVIILADHGHRLPGNARNYEKEKFHIPMLWLGGALRAKDTVVSTYASQVEFASTLLDQLSIPSDEYRWSRNVFDPNFKPFAHFVFNDGVGHVTSNGFMAFDNISKQYIHRDTGTTAFESEISKAYLQVSYQDFLNK